MNMSKVPRFTHKIQNFKTKEIITLLMEDRINLEPFYQRGDVSPKKFKSSVITSLISHLRPVRVELRYMGDGKYEAGNGAQRIYSLKKFIEGKMKTSDFSFYDHPSKQIIHVTPTRYHDLESLDCGHTIFKRFLNGIYNAVVYYDMTDEDACNEFRDYLNNTNEITPQQKRAASLHKHAHQIREWCRGNNTHPIMGFLKPDPKLKSESLVATLVAYNNMLINSGSHDVRWANSKELDSLYVKKIPNVESVLRRTKSQLDEYYNVFCIYRKNYFQMNKLFQHGIFMLLCQMSYYPWFEEMKTTLGDKFYVLFYHAVVHCRKSVERYTYINDKGNEVSLNFLRLSGRYSRKELALKSKILESRIQQMIVHGSSV